MSDAYDKIDHFLRCNLGDDDYAEYSTALDSLSRPVPVLPVLSDNEIDIYTGHIYYMGKPVGRQFRITMVRAGENLMREKMTCAVCGTSRNDHGSYPTCATHPFTPKK